MALINLHIYSFSLNVVASEIVLGNSVSTVIVYFTDCVTFSTFKQPKLFVGWTMLSQEQDGEQF